MKNVWLVLAVVVTVGLFGLSTVRVVQGVQFDIAVSEYLKRATDANTVELASANLETAITELDRRGLTTGNTGVLWQSPANDVGFFYSNLTSSLDELRSLTPDTTPLERSNMLMKLRESITDSGESGTYITGPDGLAVHPNNPFWFWSLLSTFLLMCGLWVITVVAYNRY